MSPDPDSWTRCPGEGRARETSRGDSNAARNTIPFPKSQRSPPPKKKPEDGRQSHSPLPSSRVWGPRRGREVRRGRGRCLAPSFLAPPPPGRPPGHASTVPSALRAGARRYCARCPAATPSRDPAALPVCPPGGPGDGGRGFTGGRPGGVGLGRPGAGLGHVGSPGGHSAAALPVDLVREGAALGGRHSAPRPAAATATATAARTVPVADAAAASWLSAAGLGGAGPEREAGPFRVPRSLRAAPAGRRGAVPLSPPRPWGRNGKTEVPRGEGRKGAGTETRGGVGAGSRTPGEAYSAF